MSKEELIAAAHQAIDCYNDKPEPEESGEPKFKLIKNRPMLGDFPIRWEYAGAEGSKFSYFIYAYSTLEYFAELEAPTKITNPVSFNHQGQRYRVMPQTEHESADFQEAETELIVHQLKSNAAVPSVNSFGRVDFNTPTTIHP
jgi:hypothetical protein